jgi:hypothetical protein
MESIRKAIGLSVLGVMLAGMTAAPFVVEHDRSQASAPAVVEHERTADIINHDRAGEIINHDRTAEILNHDRD